MRFLTEMNRGVPSQIPRVLLGISLVVLVCLSDSGRADRACCKRTVGCNLRTDCRCRILEIACTDPSLGIPTVGKRALSTSTSRFYETYVQSPILDRIAKIASRDQDDRWKRKASSSASRRYPIYDFDLTNF